ncbi:hypothetical protein Naga_101510g1 [Nannochloropsis gaditana]|uniref:Uncharacterized protein n=1 Tax=Nannochloropsis gaditana TaxID=72520 RepID=W7TMR1_9STRA|nr:hypothetical protein Naga_101510g1 [Nannochloropsis gaditana]
MPSQGRERWEAKPLLGRFFFPAAASFIVLEMKLVMNAEVAAKHPLASRTQAKTKIHISSVLFFLLLSQLCYSQIDAFVGLVRFSGLWRAEPLPCVSFRSTPPPARW